MSLITDNLELTEDFLQGFQKLSEQTEKEILKIALDKLTVLSARRGTLIFSDESSREINDIIKEIYREFDLKAYQGDISKLLRDVDQIGKYSIDLAAGLSPEITDISFSAQKKFIINEISERLASPESFKVNVLGEVRKIISKRLLMSSTVKELQADLRTAFLGDQYVTKYVKQITVDAVQQYKGSVNAEIQKKFELDAYLYLGSLIKTSRPQCRRWVEKYGGVLLIDTKPETKDFGYLPDEIQWAKKNGSGYGTEGKPYYIDLNLQNFSTIRGGYGCRHEAIPYRATQKSLGRSARLQKEYQKEMERLNIQAA